MLTGGTAARMGGADKAALEVGGTTLLERALAATAAAAATTIANKRVRLLPELFTTLPLRSRVPGPSAPRVRYGSCAAMGSVPKAGNFAAGLHVGLPPLSWSQV